MLQNIWSLVPIPLKDTMPVKAFTGTASNGSARFFTHTSPYVYWISKDANTSASKLIISGNVEINETSSGNKNGDGGLSRKNKIIAAVCGSVGGGYWFLCSFF